MAKIIGNTTTTPVAVPDWNQADETKANYIKNKPSILTEDDVKNLISENGNTDQQYNPESENAQSGKAVTEAIIPLDNVLREILNAIQSNSSALETIDMIEQIIVSYLENKSVMEVEG